MNNLKRKIPVNIQDIFISVGWVENNDKMKVKKKKKYIALKKEKEKRDVLEI